MTFRIMSALRAPDEIATGGAPAAPVTPAVPAVVPATPSAPVIAATTPTPAAPAVAPVTPAATPSPTAVELTPQAFNDRIRQAKENAAAEARAAILKDLGVSDPAAAKAAIAAARAAEEAGKTQAQKDADAIARLTPLAAEVEEARATFATIASAQMSSLSEAQQAAVKVIAGDDPRKQINTIKALSGTWTAPTAPVTPVAPAVVAPVAPAPIAAPASSAPAQPGPAPANPGAPVNVRDEVSKLGQSTNVRDHVLARMMILENPTAYINSFPQK